MTVRLLLKDLLVYVEKKGGKRFVANIAMLISELRSAYSNEDFLEAKDKYIKATKEIESIGFRQNDDKLYLTAQDREFRIYCGKNKYDKLFFVIDYHRNNSEQHFFYQLLSNNITIASFGWWFFYIQIWKKISWPLVRPHLGAE